MVQWFDYYVLLFCLSAVFCNSDPFLGVLQKSQGNGPLNRLLMAAKRKYMDTELPPQESEGTVKSHGRPVRTVNRCVESDLNLP